MIKKSLVALFILTLLVVPKVQAEGGSPIVALRTMVLELQNQVINLWSVVENLQQQIDDIESSPGPNGALNTYRVTSPIVSVGLGDTAETYALCNPGDQIISGGYFAEGSTLQIIQSRPDLLSPQRWYVQGSTANPPAGILPGIGTIAAYALCNDITP
ncbi:hypothetical protein HZB58_01050 [Candidatus Gottesmanbacteria bacterium]|nr:hypothetical protein [Candidatus Gottesmanbacteria bacterium]